jgi:hypothetical protein
MPPGGCGASVSAFGYVVNEYANKKTARIIKSVRFFAFNQALLSMMSLSAIRAINSPFVGLSLFV